VPVLNTAQDVFLVIVWVVVSIAYLVLLNFLWPPARRRIHNDVIGWQISIIGTIYAVMIGFMLYAVWQNFQTADANVNGEANALWPDPSFPHRTGYDFRIQEGAERCRGASTQKRR
jgi:hypothetical protein